MFILIVSSLLAFLATGIIALGSSGRYGKRREGEELRSLMDRSLFFWKMQIENYLY